MKINPKKLELAMAKECMLVGDILKRTKISRATFTRLRNGSANTLPRNVGKVAKALDVSVEYLTEGTENDWQG
jgi:transcriptional regulator with XRE-family HTH domain